MGSLDDAIREHLELKRLRGADPGQVARQEQEALGPVHRAAEPQVDGVSADETPPLEADLAHERGGPRTDAAVASGGQETAEIDMGTFLAEESGDHDAQAAEGRAEQVVVPLEGPAAVEPEVPTRTEPTLEKESDPETSEGGAPPEHPVEDVLEETPDFLRETPEQERLWFEQRPPRDFDFDK